MKNAIDLGIRNINTAFVYMNEITVGRVLNETIENSKGLLKREDFFVTTKLWNTFRSAPRVIAAMEMSLHSLNLDYVDLYFMHFPEGYLVMK